VEVEVEAALIRPVLRRLFWLAAEDLLDVNPMAAPVPAAVPHRSGEA